VDELFVMIDPVAFSIGPLAIRWYALAYIAGLLGGWGVARLLIARPPLWANDKPPLSAPALDDLLVAMTFGVILGGRLGYVLVYNLPYYAAHPVEALHIWNGGMSFHGGLTGAIIAVVLFCRWKKLAVLPVCDLMALVAPIGLFFGRLANFVNGELWGRVSDVPWAMVFSHAGPEPRHPSQLYQAGLEGICLGLLLALIAWRGGLKRPGLVAGLFGLGYGLARITGELFREPDAQISYLWGGLTMGMVLSVPVVLAGLALAVYALKRRS
jgi:phosphatidylglycerol---prolipoprotein diacylglyceryl transferase